MTNKPVALRCRRCKEVEIEFDATAVWDTGKQAYHIATVLGSFYCPTCEEPKKDRDVEEVILDENGRIPTE